MKKRICVYDDFPFLNKFYAKRLQDLKIVREHFDIKSLNRQEFKDQAKLLTERRKRVRYRKKIGEESSEFDEVSTFIIDFDLLKLDPLLTGEDVTYLVRCFSRCGLIIGLNQYGHNIFDLTLKGHPESYADLNIGSEQLDNPGLWGGGAKEFRPWHWPKLPAFIESFQERVKDVVTHPDALIFDVLEMKDIAPILPKSVSQFISGRARSLPAKMTFRQFVINSGNGLRSRDRTATDEMVGWIGAARVSKWLERLVLPGQDILVDAPHLVSRYPSLLKGNSSDVNNWNRTTNFGSYKSLSLDHSRIEEFRFKKEHWLSRPAWLWEGISSCQRIKEVSEPWKRETTNFVFCEDSSNFHSRKTCTEFVAQLDSPYVRRYILRKDKTVEYAPKERLLTS